MLSNHIIINVGRQLGSGGHDIGRMLALDFGAKYYDKELLNLAAKESGLSEHFFEKNDMNMWNINANVHYLCPISDSMRAYPVVGLGIASIYSDAFHTSTKLCVNLGGGFEANLAKDLALIIEAKYQIINNHNQFVPSVGVAYKF